MANKNNSSRVWLSQFHDKVTPIPSIEETVDPKIEALQAIMDRAIPVRAETLVMSLPAPTKFEGFHKSQEANRKVIEGLDKEFERLKIETAEIPKLLELQAEDTGNNGQTLTSPVTKKIRAHEAKNNDYIAWLKEEIEHLEDVPKPYIFKEKKEDIQKKLINRNSQLWSFNFTEWWKQRPYKDIVIAKSGKR